MQFNFYLSKCMAVNENGMSILLGSQRRNANIDEILNVMGEASAKAQALKQVITNSMRFYQTDQKVYLKSEGKLCLGMLKVGKKNLFHRDSSGNIREMQPLCVLDFYVHESVQRKGIGKELFEEMLAGEQIGADKLAYDRPSPKLLGFLRKHYNLKNYIPQNNNFVIYNQYFEIGSGVKEQKGQKEQKKQEFDQIDRMMHEMSLQKQQPQQNTGYKLVSPWATDQKACYQTTNSQMSAQLQFRK